MTEQEAITHLETVINWNEDISVPEIEAVKLAIEALKFQQSLVMCKDCRHYDTEKGWKSGYCFVCHHYMNDVDIDWDENEYCSKGERRDEQ